jgi:hypothetical protein
LAGLNRRRIGSASRETQKKNCENTGQFASGECHHNGTNPALLHKNARYPMISPAKLWAL